MNPRYPPLMICGLGVFFGAAQFLRGLSRDASWGSQMAWLALVVVNILLVGYFLRHSEP